MAREAVEYKRDANGVIHISGGHLSDTSSAVWYYRCKTIPSDKLFIETTKSRPTCIYCVLSIDSRF